MLQKTNENNEARIKKLGEEKSSLQVKVDSLSKVTYSICCVEANYVIRLTLEAELIMEQTTGQRA